MVKLSNTDKMPGKSWSLEALASCPGAFRKIKGIKEIVPSCKVCYARNGFYNMPSVKAVRQSNKKDYRRAAWTGDMVAALDDLRWFRWFDSGDCESVVLARKILEVMTATPWVQHWLPTKMYKFGKFAAIIKAMQALPNVVVRFSSDEIDGTNVGGANTSIIIPNASWLPEGATLCEAYTREGKCGPCRACWDKETATIAYPIHGASGKKAARELLKWAA